MQIKPAPRSTGAALSEYQLYVKQNYASVKKENPKKGMGEVMTLISRNFKEMKKESIEAGILAAKETSTDPEEDLRSEKSESNIDSVLHKLESVSLGS